MKKHIKGSRFRIRVDHVEATRPYRLKETICPIHYRFYYYRSRENLIDHIEWLIKDGVIPLEYAGLISRDQADLYRQIFFTLRPREAITKDNHLEMF